MEIIATVKSKCTQRTEIENDDKSGGYSEGDHLFPFRTESLSPSALMVLQLRESKSLPNLFFIVQGKIMNLSSLMKAPRNGAFFYSYHLQKKSTLIFISSSSH